MMDLLSASFTNLMIWPKMLLLKIMEQTCVAIVRTNPQVFSVLIRVYMSTTFPVPFVCCWI
jgi:hypothetical protein